MLLFSKKPILTERRKKALTLFRKKAITALEGLQKGASDSVSKQVYSKMVWNVQHTPIYFYPRRTLAETILPFKGGVIASVTKGESVNVIKIIQKGAQRFVIQDNYINLPAEHVFAEDRLTMSGIFTLAHEYAHFPKPALRQFAEANAISTNQAEELLADVLAARLAGKLGYEKAAIAVQLSSREVIYGRKAFRRFILNALK